MTEPLSAPSIYKDLLAKASTAPLSQLLPLTLQLALEIRNRRLENWARLEVNGYFSGNPALTSDVIVPEYRTVAGQHSDQYGRPLIITDAKLGFTNETRLRNSVAELEEMVTRSSLLSIRDPFMTKTIREHLQVEVMEFSFSPASISGVLSSIRAKLLDWLYEIRPEIETQGTQQLDRDSHHSIIELQGLHPTVVQVAGRLYADGHYRQAILDTYIALVQAVKTKSGRHDLDGTSLMQTIFSPKNPILVASADPDEQMGYMWMFTGAVVGIRNPKAHKLIQQEDPQVTLEWLAFASVLLRILDRAVVKSEPS